MIKRLLLIFAHPDDESFAMGGTIAKAAAEGTEIMLVSATRGEAGKTAGFCDVEDLGAVREQELRRAAEILGISEVKFLGYRDKEVAMAPPLEIIEKLMAIIREFRPQVIVTFGSDGASGHRDHRAIHHWTKAAVQLAGQPGSAELGERYAIPRLCYVQSVWRMPKEEWPNLDYRIPVGQWAEQKWEAVKAHKTQGLSREKFEKMPQEHKELYMSHEYFVGDLELSECPGRGEDLFQGIF